MLNDIVQFCFQSDSTVKAVKRMAEGSVVMMVLGDYKRSSKVESETDCFGLW